MWWLIPFLVGACVIGWYRDDIEEKAVNKLRDVCRNKYDEEFDKRLARIHGRCNEEEEM